MTSQLTLYIWCICALRFDSVFTQYQEPADFKSWPFDINPINFAFLTSSKLHEGKSESKIPAASRVYKTSGGKKVAVFDGVLSLKTFATLQLWMDLTNDWRWVSFLSFCISF